MKDYLIPGDILLPHGVDLTRWSVIACDQFTAQPEYWAEVEALVGDAPSTLRLMLPEAYLSLPDQEQRSAQILAAMQSYYQQGLFRTLHNSYIYVERTLSGGGLRRGVLGLLDLEAYDYRDDSRSPIHATEGLVQDRIPPRLKLRREACLESPHLILFYDDPEFEAPSLAAQYAGETLYDFPLMAGGGRLRGLRVSGSGADAVRAALNHLADPDLLHEKYGDCPSPVLFAVGDGNHSLATAKQYWEQLKPTLSPAEQEQHPARYALAELVNLHEVSMQFEPIHRVLFDTDESAFLQEARQRFSGSSGHIFRCLSSVGSLSLFTGGETIGQSIAACEAFVEDYAARHGGRIDYIHGLEAAEALGRKSRCAALLMPEMDKRELFPSINHSGVLPKKSFSIGPALDKRYYLECRYLGT